MGIFTHKTNSLYPYILHLYSLYPYILYPYSLYPFIALYPYNIPYIYIYIYIYNVWTSDKIEKKTQQLLKLGSLLCRERCNNRLGERGWRSPLAVSSGTPPALAGITLFQVKPCIPRETIMIVTREGLICISLQGQIKKDCMKSEDLIIWISFCAHGPDFLKLRRAVKRPRWNRVHAHPKQQWVITRTP